MMQALTHKPDLNRSSVALYLQLATLFRRRIESGEWPVGRQIPTIEELMEECGVARATIRQAVGMLEAEGLVTRFRAKGTFVNKRPGEGLWCEVESDWNGLLTSREGATIELLSNSVGEAPAIIPHPIGEICPSYRHLRRRHSKDGSAFMVADVYIDERVAQKLPEAAFTTLTALRLVSSVPGLKIVDARQTITVGSADLWSAEMLGIELNAPICFVNRSAVDQRGRLILISKGIYRGDIVRVDIKLK